MAYLFSPAQPATVAEVPIPTRTSSPLRRDSGVTVRTVLLRLTCTLSPFPLLLGAKETLHLLGQQTVSLLHLS